MTKPETNLPDTNIDIVDCLLCVKAAEPERALFSFDRDLNKISDSRRQPAFEPPKPV